MPLLVPTNFPADLSRLSALAPYFRSMTASTIEAHTVTRNLVARRQDAIWRADRCNTQVRGLFVAPLITVPASKFLPKLVLQ